LPSLVFTDETPPEVQAVVRLLFERYAPFLPLRVRHLYVAFTNDNREGDERSGPAQVLLRPEYGFAKVFLYADWLRLPQDERARTFVHEAVSHVILEPALQFTDRLVDRFGNDETAREFIREQWKLAYEQVVDELAEAIYLMVPPPGA